MSNPATIAEVKAKKPSGDTAAIVLDVVKQLVRELQTNQVVEYINLDSRFEREIGLDSLSRVELLSRIENRFNIALPEHIYVDANTPRDILRAIKQARTSTRYTPGQAVTPLEATKLTDPHGAETLIEVLQWHNAVHPQRPHIQMYNDEGSGEVITYEQLLQGAEQIAIGLQQSGVQQGQSVALMLQAGKDYFYSFYGVLLASCVPVPIYPPARPSQLEEHIRRHSGILKNCLATVLITMPEAKQVAKLLKVQVNTLHTVTTVEELMGMAGTLSKFVISPDDTAFLQYTSGSTGNPKGVILTHANILANIRAMGDRIQANSSDVFVSWLPLYHDMGLIGSWLGSLYYSMLFVVMSPLDFLRRPEHWLRAIHRYHGTLAASPNFGYEFCLHRLQESELQGLDLNSWRVAFNGAEAVSPETVKRFCERFSRYGFHKKAFMPVYGLAENSVGLAFPVPDRGPVIDRVNRQSFTSSRHAMPADETDTNVIQFVACGAPLRDCEIRIVDAANQELPERHEGQLQFRSTSATSGYFRNAEQTNSLFKDGWLNTGDLAYIADGDVYPTGRIKDIIIKAGRNLYPEELEVSVGNIKGTRKGRVAVFGSHVGSTAGTERLVIIAETREKNRKNLAEIRSLINSITSDLIGVAPDDVVLAPINTILKTSSGKIRRAACRDLYEKGQIGKKSKALWWQITRLIFSSFVPQIRRIRQLVSRFVYGIYSLSLFYLIAPPVWMLIAVLPKSAHRWKIMRAGTRLLAKGTMTPVSIQGQDNLPSTEQACIYVANHASYLDGPLLVMALERQFSFVAKIELLQSFVSRIFLRRIGSEFVERFDIEKSVGDTDRLVDIAKSKRSLLFFPEGTFSRIPGLLPMHMGAFSVAASSHSPIVPVIIRGTRSIYRADSWLPSHGNISVHIGKPITIDSTGLDKPQDTWQDALELRNKTRAYMLQHCSEPDLASV